MPRQHFPTSVGGVFVLEEVPTHGIVRACGTTKPSDNTIGYAPGCVFIDLNSSTPQTMMYINVGTKAAANFDPYVGTDLTGLTSTGAELNILTGVTATAAELNQVDNSLASNLLTRGAGVDTAESYAAGIHRCGTLITTRIVLDLTGMIGSATDLDIVGESAAASCHWGQITTAKSGTMIGGYVQCLEVPTPAGVDDLDFYSSDVSTGTQDVIITDAALGTETALVTSGGAWTALQTKGMTALPTANDYLYIVCGEASGGTFTAGKFLITLYGLGS